MSNSTATVTVRRRLAAAGLALTAAAGVGVAATATAAASHPRAAVSTMCPMTVSAKDTLNPRTGVAMTKTCRGPVTW